LQNAVTEHRNYVKELGKEKRTYNV